jgi:hypothetical protein
MARSGEPLMKGERGGLDRPIRRLVAPFAHFGDRRQQLEPLAGGDSEPFGR